MAPEGTRWTVADVASIARGRKTVLEQPFATDGAAAIVQGLWLWDFWPTQCVSGATSVLAGGSLWFALSGPAADDPDARHSVARIRMLRRDDAGWRDLGPAFPEGFTPGSREWSGSAIIDGTRLTLMFTAAGRRGELRATYEQRLFESSCMLGSDGLPDRKWTKPTELVRVGGAYAGARQAEGAIGEIEAFRDPYRFRDPSTGADHLLFTATHSGAALHAGCVGHAIRDVNGWRLSSPLISARGVNTELERAHIVRCDGRLVLFFSTQQATFASPGPVGPTGLYAFLAEKMAGPWCPAYGHGLVLANPMNDPMRAYSWFVECDGSTTGFLDRPEGRFVGTVAPSIKIDLTTLSAITL